jgi:hypothetical protein
VSDPKPYDDKAAEAALEPVRKSLRLWETLLDDEVKSVCDHLDSARAEIARLRNLCGEAMRMLDEHHGDGFRRRMHSGQWDVCEYSRLRAALDEASKP